MAASPLLVHTLHSPFKPALMTHLSAMVATVFTASSCACARCTSWKDLVGKASYLAQNRSCPSQPAVTQWSPSTQTDDTSPSCASGTTRLALLTSMSGGISPRNGAAPSPSASPRVPKTGIYFYLRV